MTAEQDDRSQILGRGHRRRTVKHPTAHLTTEELLNIHQVPDPYEPRGSGQLDEEEQKDLDACEHAISQVQRTLTTAGKALATIHRARLYRDTHTSFDSYVEDRWGMKRTHAYRMIDAWPIAAALSPIGDVNEGQVRELVPVAKRHGLDTAAAVYEEMHGQTGGKITAARLHQAVQALPPRIDGPDDARDLIRRAAAEGRLKAFVPSQTTTEENQYTGTRAVAAVAELLNLQQQIYDSLGESLVSEALLAEPKRAEYLLREIRRYARRTSHRSRAKKSES